MSNARDQNKPPTVNEKTWTCPFCQQTVRLGAYGCCASQSFFKNCLLRDHMVGDECIAYLNPRKARELMMERD
jgi:hypothetical protein